MPTAAREVRRTPSPDDGDHQVRINNPQVQEKIRQRAHEIWVQRGSQGGSDVEDWLRAEQEILLEFQK